jgi:archaellum component FlaC
MAIAINTTILPGQNVVYDDANGGVAIDYSTTLSNIAATLVVIGTNMQTISASLSNISTKITAIADVSMPASVTALQQISTDINNLKNGIDAIFVAPDSNNVLLALESIAVSLENFIGSSDSTQGGQTALIGRIADAIEVIEQQQKEFNDLASGSGIHTLSPQDWIGLISTYKLYVDDPETAIGLDKLEEYFTKIDTLPKKF